MSVGCQFSFWVCLRNSGFEVEFTLAHDCLNDKSTHMFADRVAQNASATSCDMILGKQFLFLFWVSAENSLH